MVFITFIMLMAGIQVIIPKKHNMNGASSGPPIEFYRCTLLTGTRLPSQTLPELRRE